MTSKKTLKKWFSNFMKPAQEHFYAWIDSFWHKDEKIPMDSIEGLERIVEGTASAGQLLNHLSDTNAHRALFDKKVDKEEGKGLSSEDFTAELKQKLDNLQPTNLQPLQEKITAIENTLAVDDTDLDTLQEIITQVKANKNLEQLLAGKVDKEVGKGLSTNDFTTELKEKLEKLGLFEYKQFPDKFGQGDEVKKYYLRVGGEIDISALPYGSAIEIYNFANRPCEIKVDNFFGDLPFIGSKGSKVLLKKTNDGTVFIEQFNRKMFFENFSKSKLDYYRKIEFNVPKDVTVNINRNDGYGYVYKAVPLAGVKSESVISFFFEQKLAVEKRTISLNYVGSYLDSIIFASSEDGGGDIFKCSLNYDFDGNGTVEVPIPIGSNYKFNYALLLFRVFGTPENFETGEGSVELVFNAPKVTVKN